MNEGTSMLGFVSKGLEMLKCLEKVLTDVFFKAEPLDEENFRSVSSAE